MMSPKDFEKYCESLTNEQYDALLQERIQRLNPEQQLIAQARESERKIRAKLVAKLTDPNADEDTHQMVFDSLRDMDGDMCEHNRSYAEHCLECGKLDHIMFPELFDENGFTIDEEYGIPTF